MAVAVALFPSLRFTSREVSPPLKLPVRRGWMNLNSSRAAFSAFSVRNGSSPETDCPVPLEQQPVNEFQSLSSSFPFSWAAGGLGLYCSRLACTGAAFALLVGLPVSAFGKGFLGDPETYALRCTLGAVSTGLLAFTLAVLRMYLGWALLALFLLAVYVAQHTVLSIDEETGWYDGQVWVKTPEVLARDRLLGSFSVKPVLSRVKVTLVLLAISLAASVGFLANINDPEQVLKEESGGRAVAGVYSDAAARSFEPEAFCGSAGSVSP